MEMEDVSTYVPPEILDDIDEDVIHSRMLAIIPDSIDKTEGGFVYDFTMPAAIEKADAMIRINEAIKLFFPEWSRDEWLDKLAREVGLTRRSAATAETTLTVEGEEGTVIPSGFTFATSTTLISSNVEFTTIQEITIPEGGTISVPVVCSVSGAEGNVPANTIVMMPSPLYGINSVTNENAAVGGVDEEDDDSLRERVMYADRSTDTSFVGCDADYKRWAQEVDGVGDAIVVPEWAGAGTGTVKIVIMDATGQPASEALIQSVYNHIISPDDRSQRKAPIGAILTVDTASMLDISISATVTIEADGDIANIREEFAKNITSYFEEAKQEGIENTDGIGYIRYTRVGSVLSSTEGILDYDDLLVNGGTSNISVLQDKYPTIDSITLTEEE